jgi:DNA-binding response OmpR family regulator
VRNILVTDDDVRMLRLVQRNIELRVPNVTVVTAPDGPSAWSAYASAHPDLVITNLMKRGFSGFELIGRIREYDSTTKILVITVADERYNRPRAFECGADAYLQKPCSADEVVRAVTALLFDEPPAVGEANSLTDAGDVAILRRAPSKLLEGFGLVPPISRPEDWRGVREDFEQGVADEVTGETP